VFIFLLFPISIFKPLVEILTLIYISFLNDFFELRIFFIGFF
jgi:hypothetical protein